jgi:hypothetical protein
MKLPHLPFFLLRSASRKPEELAPNDSSLTALLQGAVKTMKSKFKLLKSYERQIALGAVTVVGLAAAFQTALHVHTLVQRRRRRQLLRRCEQDAELHVFILPRSPWSPSLSPACTRVEAYLRANGIPYKAVETIDPTGAPNGELPFFVYKHERIDQLPTIFDFLAREFTVTMDDALTREERAIGAALRRTLEYSMERFLYRTVFIDHPTLAVSQIARVLHISHLRARMAVNRYAKRLHERLAITSYGALVSEQYENEFLLDCEALESQIGSKRFLFSDTELTSYDCAVYALLVPFAYMGKHTALSTAYMAVADSTVLMGYIARISKRLFSDLASQFDAADMSFETSCASSSIVEEEEEGEGEVPAVALATVPSSEAVHRDVETFDAETASTQMMEEEKSSKAKRAPPSPSPPPAAATAVPTKNPDKTPPKSTKAKKALLNSSPTKGKPSGASQKKP